FKAAGCQATESGAGCCGMAGSFGYEAEHYDVSRKIGEERLFPTVNAASEQTEIAVAGVSCRQQLEHFTDRHPRHVVEVLAQRIRPGHAYQAAISEPPAADVEPTTEAEAHARNAPEGAA
ncbi:MAG: hypothetical protein ACRDJW_19935, partial [Thermomicrobiales bacterium]